MRKITQKRFSFVDMVGGSLGTLAFTDGFWTGAAVTVVCAIVSLYMDAKYGN